jgi:methionine aminopeptidase
VSAPILTPLLVQIERVSAVANFESICEQGGYFCKNCQAFRETVEGHNGYRACACCNSIRVKWCPPIEGYKAGDVFQTDPRKSHV